MPTQNEPRRRLPVPSPAQAATAAGGAPAEEEKPIPVNGFQQVLDMLRVADPEFRASILRGLAKRDRAMTLRLMRELGM